MPDFFFPKTVSFCRLLAVHPSPGRAARQSVGDVVQHIVKHGILFMNPSPFVGGGRVRVASFLFLPILMGFKRVRDATRRSK